MRTIPCLNCGTPVGIPPFVEAREVRCVSCGNRRHLERQEKAREIRNQIERLTYSQSRPIRTGSGNPRIGEQRWWRYERQIRELTERLKELVTERHKELEGNNNA